jgi:hypothetical protein
VGRSPRSEWRVIDGALINVSARQGIAVTI